MPGTAVMRGRGFSFADGGAGSEICRHQDRLRATWGQVPWCARRVASPHFPPPKICPARLRAPPLACALCPFDANANSVPGSNALASTPRPIAGVANHLSGIRIHHCHHLIVAAREKPPMRDVHRKTGRFLAWRERPLRRHFQIVCVNLQFFALVLNIDVNMPRAIRHAQIPVCPLPGSFRARFRWRHQSQWHRCSGRSS